MSTPQNDRNLLVGVLALQMDLVTQDQLILALQAWMLNKSCAIEQLLVDKGFIRGDSKDFLSSIAESHLRLHADKVQNSLAALSSLGSVRKKLAELEDSDIEATMVQADKIRLAEASTHPVVNVDHEPSVTFIETPSEVSGRFRILRPHARGGLGVVSVAEDTELHREVALKEIQAPHAEDSGSRTRFLMEAEVTGRLEHPGIVPVYSLGKTSTGNPFYVMRFIRGDSLKDAVAKLHSAKPMSPDEQATAIRKLVRRLIDVCNAIEYAHSRGVLHRDLKPGNIMLGKYGETLVVDWGLAKAVGRQSVSNTDEATFIPVSSEGSTETRMGSVVGTRAYMSPEQATGQLDLLGPRSDVYCLGATLYCVLTGQPPIEKGTTEEMLAAIRSGRIKSVREANPSVDATLAAICHKALAVVPTDRYESAASMADDLELWLTDQPVSAWKEPFLNRAGRWLRKHQTLAASSGVLAISAIVGLLFVNSLTRRQNDELRKAQLAEANSRKVAENRLLIARDVTLDLVNISEQVLSQPDAAKQLREEVVDKAYELFRDLHSEAPEDQTNADLFARVARIAGNLKALESKFPEAKERLDAAYQTMKSRLAKETSDEKLKIPLAELLRDISRLERRSDKINPAVDRLEEAKSILAEVKSPTLLQNAQKVLAWIENTEISLRQELWQLEDALKLADSSILKFRAFVESGKPHPQDQQFLVFALYRRGRILDFLGRTDESLAAFDKAIEALRAIRSVFGNKQFSVELVRTLSWSAEARSRQTELHPLAKEHIAEAIKLVQPMAAKPSASPSILLYWADANKIAGRIFLLEHDLAAAEAAIRIAVQTSEGLVAKNDLSYNNAVLAEALENLSQLERAKGNTTSSDDLHRRAISTMEKACQQLPESGELKKLTDRIRSPKTAL